MKALSQKSGVSFCFLFFSKNVPAEVTYILLSDTFENLTRNGATFCSPATPLFSDTCVYLKRVPRFRAGTRGLSCVVCICAIHSRGTSRVSSVSSRLLSLHPFSPLPRLLVPVDRPLSLPPNAEGWLPSFYPSRYSGLHFCVFKLGCVLRSRFER